MNARIQVLILLALLAPGISQAEYKAEYRIERTETLRIVSQVNQHEYELYIQLPRDYASSTRTYPVVMLQDTGFSFPITSGIVRLMGGQDIDSPILVGISYSKGTSPEVSRTRDFTPTHAPDEKGAHSLEAQQSSGGALDYIKFMEDEVIPLVSEKYRVDTNRKIFIGHSFGGLLGAYILLVNAELFDHYILSSPSLWYDDHAIFRLEEEYAEDNASMHATVHMYIGGEERKSKRSDMVQDVLNFERTLASRNYSGLTINAHVLEGATHYSAFPSLLPDALTTVLPPPGD